MEAKTPKRMAHELIQSSYPLIEHAARRRSKPCLLPRPRASMTAIVLGLVALVGGQPADAGVVTTGIVSEASVDIVATPFTQPFPNEIDSRHVALSGVYSRTESVTSVLAEAKEPTDFFSFFSAKAFQNVDGVDYVKVAAQAYGSPVRVSSMSAQARYVVSTLPIIGATHDPTFGFHITGGAIEIGNLGDTQATVHLRAEAGRGNNGAISAAQPSWAFDAILVVDGASGSLLPLLDTSASTPLGIGLPTFSYSYDLQSDGFKVSIDAFDGLYDFHDQLVYELTAEITGDLGLTGITAWIADPSSISGPPLPFTIDGVVISDLPLASAVPLPPAVLMFASALPVFYCIRRRWPLVRAA